MTNKKRTRNPEKVIAIGHAFDSIIDDDDKYIAMIMIVTGYVVENIREEFYSEFLEDFKKDALENIEQFKEFAKSGLINVEPMGNA